MIDVQEFLGIKNRWSHLYERGVEKGLPVLHNSQAAEQQSAPCSGASDYVTLSEQPFSHLANCVEELAQTLAARGSLRVSIQIKND